MMFDLKNRKALITGAGQGMGLGITKALKDAGANVFITIYTPSAHRPQPPKLAQAPYLVISLCLLYTSDAADE